jgi:hypothetical protein
MFMDASPKEHYNLKDGWSRLFSRNSKKGHVDFHLLICSWLMKLPVLSHPVDGIISNHSTHPLPP